MENDLFQIFDTDAWASYDSRRNIAKTLINMTHINNPETIRIADEIIRNIRNEGKLKYKIKNSAIKFLNHFRNDWKVIFSENIEISGHLTRGFSSRVSEVEGIPARVIVETSEIKKRFRCRVIDNSGLIDEYYDINKLALKFPEALPILAENGIYVIKKF